MMTPLSDWRVSDIITLLFNKVKVFMDRLILHIDMNSYFATVEQQANSRLRGRPVAVLGSKAKRTIIVASSIEAKRLGIKTGYALHEAIKICPNLVIVHGEPRKYADVTRRFIDIFESYTDKVEIFSIDEAFLDITSTAQIYGGAISVAKEIKSRIRNEIGSWISCSIGLGPNKFLAKTGSDLEKPDGLIIIDKTNKDQILLHLPLEDYCGIGRAIFRRLEGLGVTETKALRTIPIAKLKQEFGVICAWKLKQMVNGLDPSPVIPWREQKAAKSFSCSRTLNKDVTNKKEMRTQILFLFEKVAKKLRDDGYWAKEVGLWLRFKDFSGYGKSMKIGYWSCDGLDFYNYTMKIFDQVQIRQPVRAIGVFVGSVQLNKNVPLSFLADDANKEKILKVCDEINNRFGDGTVTRGKIINSRLKEIVSGMGRKKF